MSLFKTSAVIGLAFSQVAMAQDMDFTKIEVPHLSRESLSSCIAKAREPYSDQALSHFVYDEGHDLNCSLAIYEEDGIVRGIFDAKQRIDEKTAIYYLLKTQSCGEAFIGSGLVKFGVSEAATLATINSGKMIYPYAPSFDNLNADAVTQKNTIPDRDDHIRTVEENLAIIADVSTSGVVREKLRQSEKKGVISEYPQLCLTS